MAEVAPHSTTQRNASTTTRRTATAPAVINGLTVDQATQQVHLAIRSLLTDEFPDLASKDAGKIEGGSKEYLNLTFNSIKNYTKTSWKTWWGVIYSFLKMCVGGVSPIDFFISVLFAFCITTILTAGMIICIIAKFPLLDKAFNAYGKRYGGVSFINIVNSNMFKEFSEEELQLAKEAMSSTEPPQENVLNIDVAKMMLLFSALVYERSTPAKREGIKQLSGMDWGRKGEGLAALLPNHQHDLFRLFHLDESKGSPISPTSPESTQSPTAMQTAPTSDQPTTETTPAPPRSITAPPTFIPPRPSIFQRPSRYGTFAPEFSKWQQKYIMQSPYWTLLPFDEAQGADSDEERVTHQTRVDSAAHSQTQPANGYSTAQPPPKHEGGIIFEAMQRWGFEYEPVSELDSASSAYSAAFWDKNSNWIVVSFKGTSPPEYDEWLVDFDYTRVPIGEYIPNYATAHHGFKNRLFPDEPTLNRTPYETIVLALKVISDDLLSRTTTGVVNVYLTGHSLGSGIASLAYSRLMQNIDGLDKRVRICDAYMFSSPIATDMPSAELFNHQIVNGPNGPRTIWRLVNHHDAVATLFPAMGDDPRYAYPDSLFAFAHLGTEVKMRRNGEQNIAANNYAKTSATATAVSGLPPEKVGVIPKGVQVPRWMLWAQHVPLAGWMFSHFPGLYFESLHAMSAGPMNWKRKGSLD